MKNIHPAIAEHAMQESERLSEALRRIADLPIDRCITENDYRLSAAKAIALAALSQQAEPVCDWPTCECALDLDKCKVQSVEPAPAQDERYQFDGAVLRSETGEYLAEFVGYRQSFIDSLLATRPAQTAPQHSDDAAVDRFAAAMKAKLAAARAKGRAGWDDPVACSGEFLAQLLVEHLAKGNAGTFEDVANFAMMLHQRGADPKVLAEAAAPHPEQSGLYTCIGKGGSYELIGRATTAGALKVTGRFADEVIVYRDTESSALYCREPGDFRLRMARAALSAQGGDV